MEPVESGPRVTTGKEVVPVFHGVHTSIQVFNLLTMERFTIDCLQVGVEMFFVVDILEINVCFHQQQMPQNWLYV